MAVLSRRAELVGVPTPTVAKNIAPAISPEKSPPEKRPRREKRRRGGYEEATVISEDNRLNRMFASTGIFLGYLVN